MKVYSTQNIRNVVLLGSTKSGKTTLSEAMLYEGKVIDRRGTVEAKNTVSDNAEIEQINQRSIYATPLYAEFMDTKFNIIDTPGADDFVGGAVSAFKVCDTGVLVINAQQGVEVGTQIYSRYAREYGIRYRGLPQAADDSFFLCKELEKGFLNGVTGEYSPPGGYFVSVERAIEFEEYEKTFPPKEKLKLPGQLI